MAEVAAALGVAGNVLQFLDFGSKVASRLRECHRTNHDRSDSISSIQTLTRDLKGILLELKSERRDGSIQDNHTAFSQLADDCGKVADDLLKKLKPLCNYREGKLSAFKTAVKTVWKEEDIARLQLRLDQFRSQLILQLAVASREQIRNSELRQTQLIQEIHSRIDKLQGVPNTQPQSTESLGSYIVDMVVSKLAAVERPKQKESLEDALVRSVLVDDRATIDKDASPPVLSASRRKQLVDRILSRLRFANMSDREDSIADAHATTFKWIFDNGDKHAGRWSSLPEWLASDQSIYWVTGKAGSGKSTLMKYICQELDAQLAHDTRAQPNTRSDNYLRKWAPHPLKLIRATFFFWSSGAEIQMSQTGLLRSLLFQLLSRSPSLIPRMFPQEWEAMALYGLNAVERWDRTDDKLMKMLRAIIADLESDTRLCLFIDGLDEFSGDHEHLVQLFKQLSDDPKVKICVSSRPWDIFETTFEQAPSLRMEALTHDDIVSYTSDRLLSDREFRQLKTHGGAKHADHFINEIVTKAAGVFLWVKLVINSLLAGMRDGDRIEDLQNRLKKLPPDLEKLYDNMIENIDRDNIEHTAQLFTMVATPSEPVNVILLSFIDDESYHSAISRPIAILTPNEEKYRYEQMRRRLSSRTMGLLELNRNTSRRQSNADLTVQYLHKTVYDYIQTPKVKSRLESAIRSTFDVHMRICIGILAYSKTWTQYPLAQRTPWPDVTQFMQSASQIKPENHATAIKIMDAFDKTISKIRHEKDWHGYHPGLHRSRRCHHFLSLSIKYGVTYYIEARVTKPCVVPGIRYNKYDELRKIKGYPLLADAVSLYGPFQRFGKIQDLQFLRPNTTSLRTLIDLGAQFEIEPCSAAVLYDPAIIIAKSLLSRRRSQIDREELLVWRKAVRLLIKRHDDIWSVDSLRTWTQDAKSDYHTVLRDRSDRFCPEPDASSGIRAKVRVLLSLRDSKSNIHRARLQMLNNIDRELTACTADSSQQQVTWLPKQGTLRLDRLFPDKNPVVEEVIVVEPNRR